MNHTESTRFGFNECSNLTFRPHSPERHTTTRGADVLVVEVEHHQRRVNSKRFRERGGTRVADRVDPEEELHQRRVDPELAARSIPVYSTAPALPPPAAFARSLPPHSHAPSSLAQTSIFLNKRTWFGHSQSHRTI
jgi:hypothetical protein